MKTQIRIMNPSGNITALVRGVEDKELRKRLSERLMQQNDNHIEQVGFLAEPIYDGSIRVEMMGGEFCGNALRCAALYHALEKGIKGQAIIPVEISGNEGVVAVAVNSEKMEAMATMPLPCRSYQAEINNEAAYVCDFGGIVHIVLPEAIPDEDIIDDMLQYAIVHFDAEAIGLIFTSLETETICPVVFVPAVGSLVFENSCASGTLAASVFKASQMKDGRYNMLWNQPGGALSVDLRKAGGKVAQMVLSGKISICEDMEIDVEDFLQPADICDIEYLK